MPSGVEVTSAREEVVTVKELCVAGPPGPPGPVRPQLRNRKRVAEASQGWGDPKEIRMTSDGQGPRVGLAVRVCVGNQVLQGCLAQRDIRWLSFNSAVHLTRVI